MYHRHVTVHAQAYALRPVQMGVKVLVKDVKVVVRMGVLQHVPMDVTKHVQADAGMVVRTHV